MYVSVASYQFGVLERQGKPDGGSPSSSAQPRVVPRRSQLRRCLGVTHVIIGCHICGDWVSHMKSLPTSMVIVPSAILMMPPGLTLWASFS